MAVWRLPSIFLSGIVLPVENLPNWAQGLSWLTPLYHAEEVLRPLVAGEALSEHGGRLAMLPLYGLIVLVVARWTLNERD